MIKIKAYVQREMLVSCNKPEKVEISEAPDDDDVTDDIFKQVVPILDKMLEV